MHQRLAQNRNAWNGTKVKKVQNHYITRRGKHSTRRGEQTTLFGNNSLIARRGEHSNRRGEQTLLSVGKCDF